MSPKPSYRALIVDVDGTLVDDSFVVTTPVREALTQLTADGVTVSLSTGKPLQSCLDYIDPMNLTGYHTFCAGAHVTDLQTGDLYASRLDPERVTEAVLLCREANITLELYTHEGYFMELDNDYARIQKKYMLFAPTIVDDLVALVKENDLIKGHLILGTDKEKQAGEVIRERLADHFTFSIGHVSGRRDLDFYSLLEKGVTKRVALEQISHAIAIPLEQMVAIGDSGGDIGILQAAGVGVAMGDAPDAVKSAADCVVAGVKQDGLLEAVARFFPNSLR